MLAFRDNMKSAFKAKKSVQTAALELLPSNYGRTRTPCLTQCHNISTGTLIVQPVFTHCPPPPLSTPSLLCTHHANHLPVCQASVSQRLSPSSVP